MCIHSFTVSVICSLNAHTWAPALRPAVSEASRKQQGGKQSPCPHCAPCSAGDGGRGWVIVNQMMVTSDMNENKPGKGAEGGWWGGICLHTDLHSSSRWS